MLRFKPILLCLGFMLLCMVGVQADLFAAKSIALTETTLLYQEPFSKALSPYAISSQTVDVLQEQADWLQIRTWAGSFWIKDNSKHVSIPILMYHDFDENSSDTATVHPDLFKRQMLRLKDEGYTTITDHDLLAFFKGERLLPEKPVMITMDDGYRSNYTYAFPILKELQMKATIYVIAERIEHPERYVSQTITPKIAWHHAKEMYKSGLIDIQSHTYNLHSKDIHKDGREAGVILGPIFKKETKNWETDEEYKRRVLEDITFSKKVIEEQIGNKVITLCYPYGEHNKTSEELVKQAGFQMSVTIHEGMNNKQAGPFLLKRINVPGWKSPDGLMKDIESYKK